MKPNWLETKDNIAPCPCCKIWAVKESFLERTLREITSFFRDGLFSEEFVNKDGILQKIDPRVKVVSLMVLIIVVSLLRHLFLIAGLYLFILLLVTLSKIPFRSFIPRVWLFIPLFSGIIAIPSLFNIFVPGEPLLTIIKFKDKVFIGPFEIPETISITKQGLSTATLFIMRVTTSVSLVVLLVLTTRWQYLLKSLRTLQVPQMFTFIISMTYRYIHLLLRLIEEIHLAKKSRVIKKTTLSEGQRWVTSQIGVILKRSLKMSEDVYSAMVSRGFANDVKILDTFMIRKIDYLWSILSIIIISFMIGLNRMLD
jgi:cobalt/nickel transport system permease protein